MDLFASAIGNVVSSTHFSLSHGSPFLSSTSPGRLLFIYLSIHLTVLTDQSHSDSIRGFLAVRGNKQHAA